MKRRLTENLKRVRDRIAGAAEAANRSPDDITLVAVTKSVGIDVIRTCVENGFTLLGESHVQELTRRASMIHEHFSRRKLTSRAHFVELPQWHMIGHLQRNKVKSVLPWTDMIQSLDSLRLAEEIHTQAAKINRRVKVLMEVNAGGEASKFGVAVGAAIHLLEQVVSLDHLEVCGLMTMAPFDAPELEVRRCFTRLRELFEEIQDLKLAGPSFKHLSMGMSSDFEYGIQEGATMVRIGTALFEGISAPVG